MAALRLRDTCGMVCSILPLPQIAFTTLTDYLGALTRVQCPLSGLNFEGGNIDTHASAARVSCVLVRPSLRGGVKPYGFSGALVCGSTVDKLQGELH